jgi:hypothetical protein
VCRVKCSSETLDDWGAGCGIVHRRLSAGTVRVRDFP